MVEIIPAILTDSQVKFKELMLKLEPYAGRIHVDVADGEFVPNKTVTGYEEIKGIEAAVKFDVHLMVKKPQDHIKEWLHTYVDRFIVHAESNSPAGGDLVEIIKIIKDHKRKVGIAINPETDTDGIEKYLKDIDFVQFMTVHPGFQGGEFVHEVVDKISAFHEEYPGIMIMADGGITPETAPKLVKAGASVLVCGSYIVKSQNVEAAIKVLGESIKDISH